jgi:hypothetical protein
MRLAVFVVVAVLAPAERDILSAQTSPGEARAFAALRASHIGALTPLMTPAMVSRTLNGAQLGVRYGLRDESGIRTQSIAGTALFGIGIQSSLLLTAGVSDADCASCNPAMLLGIGGDMRVYEGGDVAGGGSSLTVTVSGELGYAQLKPDKAFVLGVGAPITLSLAAGGREGMRFVPFVTPVFGIGQTSAPCPGVMVCDQSGTRWVLGGGIGVWNPLSSVSASIGVNQVMLSGAKPVFGINVAFGGR